MDSRFITLQVRLPNVLFLAASLYVSVSGSEAPVGYTAEAPGSWTPGPADADSTLHAKTPHAVVTSTPPQVGIEAGYPTTARMAADPPSSSEATASLEASAEGQMAGTLLAVGDERRVTMESPSKDGSQDSAKSTAATGGFTPSLAMTIKDTWILQSQTVTSKASMMTPSQTITRLEAVTRDGHTVAAEDGATLPSKILQATGDTPISPSMTAEDETTLPSVILQATGDTPVSPPMTAEDETALPSVILRASAARDVGAQGRSRRSPQDSTRPRTDGEKPAHYTAMLHVALRACPRRVGPDDHIPVLLDQLCQLLRSRFRVEDFEVRWRPHESVHVLSPDDELTHTVPHEELTANCRKPVESMGSQT